MCRAMLNFWGSTWMSQEVRIKGCGLLTYLSNDIYIYWGYKPYTKHLPTSWDIQVGYVLIVSFPIENGMIFRFYVHYEIYDPPFESTHFLLKMRIFQCHVNFQGCRFTKPPKIKMFHKTFSQWPPGENRVYSNVMSIFVVYRIYLHLPYKYQPSM